MAKMNNMLKQAQQMQTNASRILSIEFCAVEVRGVAGWGGSLPPGNLPFPLFDPLVTCFA